MTLLEVLVAMAVLAIGIAGTLGAISACLRTTDAATAYSRGALLAQQVASEFQRSDTLTPGEYDGTFDSSGAGYTWAVEVGEADSEGLYPVTVTIKWAAETRSYVLETKMRPHALPTPAEAENANDGGAAGAGTNTPPTTQTPTTPTSPGTPTTPGIPTSAPRRGR